METTNFQISVPEEYRIDTGAIYHQLSLADLHLEVPQVGVFVQMATSPLRHWPCHPLFPVSSPSLSQIKAYYNLLSLPQIDWLRYFSTVLSEVPFDSSERVVSYSMPYFIDLGPLLEATEKRYCDIRRIGHYFLDKSIWWNSLVFGEHGHGTPLKYVPYQHPPLIVVAKPCTNVNSFPEHC